MFYALAFLLFIGLCVASEVLGNRKHRKAALAHTYSQGTEEVTERHFQGGHYPPHFYQQGPIFSPDKRYIWDPQNQRWIPNNGGLGLGLMIGLAIGIGAALLLYFA